MTRLCSYCERKIDEDELLLRGTLICVCGHILTRADTFKAPKRYFAKGDPHKRVERQKEKRKKTKKTKRKQEQKIRRR